MPCPSAPTRTHGFPQRLPQLGLARGRGAAVGLEGSLKPEAAARPVPRVEGGPELAGLLLEPEAPAVRGERVGG